LKPDKKEFQNLTNKERAEIYADLKKHDELYFGPKHSPRRIIHTSRFNHLLKLIGDVKNKKILDAGCGEGYFLSLVKSNKKFGVELSEKRISKALKLYPDLKIKIADVTHLPFEDNTFDVIFAGGITDPHVSVEKINYSNIEFPNRVIEATFDHSNFRYLTLGSINENVELSYKNNNYLRSKLELGRLIEKKSYESNGKDRFLHLRLHTLYGGKPKDHMFLGQIANAIKNGTVFRMSSGLQLREYHHVDDIAVTIRSILEREWNFGPIVEINSGKPVRLAELAKAIFKAFKKEELLEIGSIPTPSGENMEKVFQRSEDWLMSFSRTSISGVIESLKQYLKT